MGAKILYNHATDMQKIYMPYHKPDRCNHLHGSVVNTVGVTKTEFLHAVESPSFGVASQPELWIRTLKPSKATKDL